MALADWEILLGGNLFLSELYKVSGSKSLSQTEGGGVTFLVHKQTYNDAPLNVRVTTWMTHDDVMYDPMGYFIGGIARKLPDVNTYIYWYLDIELSTGEGFLPTTADKPCRFIVGYYENGTQNQLLAQKISFSESVWNYGKWRYFVIEGYESEGKFNVSIKMSAEIETPDVSNPPTEFVDSFSYSFDLPESLKQGGACGIVVGSRRWTTRSKGQGFWDYTQLWY